MNYTLNEIDLRKLDLNLLLAFSALWKDRSVSKAASRLYLGPSAMSMALGRLRKNLNDDLFVRTPNGMEPTPVAERFWEQVGPALQEIEAALRSTRAFDPATEGRVFRFAAPDDLSLSLVPKLIKVLGAASPGSVLVVRPSDFRTLLGRLDSGDADVALSARPVYGIEKRHYIQPVAREGFLTLYDAAQLGTTGPLSMAHWLETPQLLLTIDGELEGQIDEQLRRLGKARRIVAGLTQFPVAPHILKSQACLINMPAMAARQYAGMFDLEACEPPIPFPDFEVMLAWHSRTDRDPAQTWFRNLVVGCLPYAPMPATRPK